jgi:hypothetical protein
LTFVATVASTHHSQNLKLAQSCVLFFVRYGAIIAMLQYNLRPVGAVCLLLFCLAATGVHALDAGEVVALKDMQLEWGQQIGWTGAPNCEWEGISCSSMGHIAEL